MTEPKALVQSALSEGKLSSSAAEGILRWLTAPHCAPLRSELVKQIEAADWEELNEAFYQVLPFGTGGRRGKVGVGTNRMNRVTVAESAQGVANRLLAEIKDRRPRVVVACDTRNSSPEFTEVCATTFAANGVKVFLFDGYRATPQLSFAVLNRKADAGVVISASHNPPQDNGFKAYWSDGGQVVPPIDKALIDEVAHITETKSMGYEEARSQGLIELLTPVDDEDYVKALVAQAVGTKRELKIVYTPIHGVGLRSVLPVLQGAGFKDILVEPSQAKADGNFPTVKSGKPNPEETAGWTVAIDLAKKEKGDLVLATDPDADRLACAVPTREPGEFVVLTGNRSGALLMSFIAEMMSKAGTLKPQHTVYTTIVSSPLMATIARSYGLSVTDDLLVGFKWVANRIKQQRNPQDFLFGFEESIGFMKGPQTRDKDGAMAALLFCEMAAELKSQGRTVLDYLDDLYRRHGYFSDYGTSVFLEGTAGQDRMERIMDALRKKPLSILGGIPVLRVTDRSTNEVKDLSGKVLGTVADPYRSNLLIYHFDQDNKSWVAIRPSGTEPKIKFYFSLHRPVGQTDDLENLKAETDRKLRELCDQLVAMALSIE